MTAWKPRRGGGGRSIGSAAALAAWLVAGSALAAPAAAGSFKVNPVQINLPADRKAASLRLTNSDSAPVSVRVLTYKWTQVDGLDVHTPTSNVIVSPPMFTMAAGQAQLVRSGLRDRAASGAYRVILEEIPSDKPVKGQVQIVLRLNLPLYVLPRDGGRTDLSWRAWRDPSGDLFVEGRNQGSLPGQVLALAAVQSGRRHVLSSQMGVVLPGSARRWKADKGSDLAAGVPLLLTVKGPAGETQTQIMLERR